MFGSLRRTKPTKRASLSATLERLPLTTTTETSAAQSSESSSTSPPVYGTLLSSLQTIYAEKLLPVEEYYDYAACYPAPLTGADFDLTPMVLLVGQYSTGKTTLIQHLLQADYPDSRIGPHPTTDTFTVVMYGEEEAVIPGNALVADPGRPFGSLARFGSAFLARLRCATLPNELLKRLTLIDTPGILEQESSAQRGFDLDGVFGWFAERASRILLVFDSDKLDMSARFSTLIARIQLDQEDQQKVRVVMNKADRLVGSQDLMRVYGALLWSLSRTLPTLLELPRVYIGTFWSNPLLHNTNRTLFGLEEADFLHDLSLLPRLAAVGKLSNLLRRTRHVYAHAHLVGHLQKALPTFNKNESKSKFLERLPAMLEEIERHNSICVADFPPVDTLRKLLDGLDWAKLRPLKPAKLEACREIMIRDIPALFSLLDREDRAVDYGVFRRHSECNPFRLDQDAIDQFEDLHPVDGRLSADRVKLWLEGGSKLPHWVLGHIWSLADVDGDNQADVEEFALALHLTQLAVNGRRLPDSLPSDLLPPSKRNSTSTAGTAGQLPHINDLPSQD